MVVHEGIAEQPDAINQWSEALEELHRRIAHRFVRPVRYRAPNL